MKKITLEDFWVLGSEELWNHIDALQKEVERLESENGLDRKTISVEGIEAFLRKKLHGWYIGSVDLDKEFGPHGYGFLAEIIQPLTAQQGFVPDWSKAPDTADRIDICWASGHYREGFHSIPRPTPKTGEKTAQQLAKEYVDKMVGGGNRADAYLILVEKLHNGEKLDDLCTAVGISLTVTEE